MIRAITWMLFFFVFEINAQIKDSIEVDGTLIPVELLEEITLKPLLLNSAEKIIPVITPETLFDKNPLMKPIVYDKD